MSEPLRGVVVAHGDLAAGLVDAARQISGVQEDALVPISNRGCSPDTLMQRLREEAARGPLIVFTDLPNGSCAMAARRVQHELPGVPVVSGVNLPMMLDFATHRHLPLDELLARLLERGRAHITCATPGAESHGDRALSRG